MLKVSADTPDGEPGVLYRHELLYLTNSPDILALLQYSWYSLPVRVRI
jgi:hypothetical protein